MKAAMLSRESCPEQEPLQEPLSLSLTAFFTDLKNSICQLYVMEAEKNGFANPLPVSCCRSCRPQSLLCEGRVQCPAMLVVHGITDTFFMSSFFPPWSLKAASDASFFLPSS